MIEGSGVIHSRVIIASVIVLLISVMLFPIYKVMFFHIPAQIELDKCPLCLGSNMCDCFLHNNFTLNWDHLWTNLLNIILEKPILFGSCGTEMVVLKRFQSDTAIPKSVMLSGEHLNLDDVFKLMKNRSSLNHSNQTQNLILCPSTKRVDYLLKPVIEGGFKDIPEMYQGLNVYYTLQVDIEPLIQQITKEWAVAQYLGACGDIAVSKYCGVTLTWVFPKISWEERSLIAKQLLLFAFNATFDNPAFSFYFTDVSPDNIAISSTGDIRLVDLDSVIIVDKEHTDSSNAWEAVHENYHDDNDIGFAFSPEEICSHRISDMNIYAICQGILSEKSYLLEGGLLHSPPIHFLGLKELIEDCVSPPAGRSRFDIAHAIINTLDL